MIAGASVGCVVLICICVVAVFLIRRRRATSAATAATTTEEATTTKEVTKTDCATVVPVQEDQELPLGALQGRRAVYEAGQGEVARGWGRGRPATALIELPGARR